MKSCSLGVVGFSPRSAGNRPQHAGAAKYYQLYYNQYLPPAVGQAVNDATQGLFAGTTSPEDVAKTIEEAAATELKQ